MSVATIFASSRSFARLIAIAPDPVPRSKIRGVFKVETSFRVSSISNSVSGRGINTCSLTINSNDQNSYLPVIYASGSPLLRRFRAEVNSSSCCSVSVCSG